jgi:hypothetical protein
MQGRKDISFGRVRKIATGFNEILYLSIFRKPVDRIQVSLETYNNNGYFT